jgi:hypothetical protein
MGKRKNVCPPYLGYTYNTAKNTVLSTSTHKRRIALLKAFAQAVA